MFSSNKANSMPDNLNQSYSQVSDNPDHSLQNIKGKKKKCCSRCPKAECCNRCMCCYIQIAVVIGLTALILVTVYEIIPLFTFKVDLTSLHIQLFNYHVHEEKYMDYFNKVTLNGTGGFIVTAFNAAKLGVYMHDWEIALTGTNLYNNPEKFGYVRCCTAPPKWNRSNPFYGNETFIYDKRQWFGSKESNNLTMTLFATSISEELFYMAWQVSWLNDWRLNLGLNGAGWGKTKMLGFDINVALDCSVDVNSSYFFPLDPPHWNISWNITENEKCNKQQNISYIKDYIGRLPPKKYNWQEFPVIDLNCSFSIGQIRYT